MNLSRAAKQFRNRMPGEPRAPKAKAKNQNQVESPPAPVSPTPLPVAEVPPVEPISEPVAATAQAAKPVPTAVLERAEPARAKRPRFVREKAESRERSLAPALPLRSSKLAARLLTRNLSLPPRDDAPKTGR